jgi:rhodanese-related sulfurtransferase
LEGLRDRVRLPLGEHLSGTSRAEGTGGTGPVEPGGARSAVKKALRCGRLGRLYSLECVSCPGGGRKAGDAVLPGKTPRVREEPLTSEAIRPDGVVIREISPAELKDRVEGGDPPLLVDVREAFERHIADLPGFGQVRIPVGEIPSRGLELDPDSEIVMYCRSGPRSAWATERLMEMGFKRVFNLKGGLLAWKSQVDPDLPAY